MYHWFAVVALISLSACSYFDGNASRQVVSVTSQEGQEFLFMPIHEQGVTDITVRIAWPTNWVRTSVLNSAVPFIGADLILNGGTVELKPQEVMEKFNDTNVKGNIAASPDYIFGEVSFPKEHIEETVRIASEMLANPQLDEDWLDRIKHKWMKNQNEARALSSSQMWSAARLKILGDTPIFRALDLPDHAGIGAITRSDILDWHKQIFTKSAQSVVVTGAISEKDAGEVVDRLFQGLPDGKLVEPEEDAADFSPATILLHLPEAETTMFAMIGQLPPTKKDGDHDDLLAVSLLGDTNGPLFETIRTELRATYGLQAAFTNYTRHLRPFLIFGEVETAKLEKVRELTLAAYEAFRLNPDLTGLDELQASIVAGTQENVKFVDIAARTIMELQLDGKDPTIAPRLHELFASATPQSIQARLKDAFPPAKELIVVAVSPDAEAMPGACVITSLEEMDTCK